MRSSLLAAFLLAAACVPAETHAEETLNCTSEKKLGGGASKSTELKLTVAGILVKNIWFSGCYAAGKEGGGSCCFLEPDDATWTWIRKGPVTVLSIKLEPSGEAHKIEIERKGDAFEVRFAEPGLHVFCGFAADFPAAVTLKRGERACQVVESR